MNIHIHVYNFYSHVVTFTNTTVSGSQRCFTLTVKEFLFIHTYKEIKNKRTAQTTSKRGMYFIILHVYLIFLWFISHIINFCYKYTKGIMF